MNMIIEFFLRSLIGIVLLVSLIITTILLAPVHLLIMLFASMRENDVRSQWVW
jgi:hypothetical protein